MGSATTRESEVAVQREFTQELDGGGFMWREPRNSIRLAFDPGGEVELRGGEINSHTPVLKEYLDIYMAQDPQVSEIIRELLDQPPTPVVLSGHDFTASGCPQPPYRSLSRRSEPSGRYFRGSYCDSGGREGDCHRFFVEQRTSIVRVS